jgi:hypothetical protein
MTREHVILETAIDEAGETFRAAYFIEDGVIHANIAGKVLRIPAGINAPERTVPTPLYGHLLRSGLRAKHAILWKGRIARPAHG